MVDQRRIDNQPKPWLSAAEAARRLGVQRRTLYAYVSRGLLHSVPGVRGRARRYAGADIERLRARHDARAGHGVVAAGALRWGEPVLASQITTFDARGPVYRGHAAVELAARGVGFERVAELLWTGVLPDQAAAWPAPRLPVARLAALAPHGGPPAFALPLVVAALALGDEGRHAGGDAGLCARARPLIVALAATAGPTLARDAVERALGRASDGDGVAATLAAALGLPARATDARRGVAAALVLMADHELNASTFAARVAAGTGADLYACLGAALGAWSGPRHGGATARVEALVDETGTPARAAATLRARLARGEELADLGHPLYPGGDPRAAPLLALARHLGGDRPRVRTILALADAAPAATGLRPNCDFGLVALADAIGLPRGGAAALYAVGRTAGWVAHVLEQRAQGFMIRPRAAPAPGAAVAPGAPAPTG